MTRWSHACRAQSAAVDLVRGLRVSLCAGESNDEVCVHKLRLQQAGTHSARCSVKQILPGPHLASHGFPQANAADCRIDAEGRSEVTMLQTLHSI